MKASAPSAGADPYFAWAQATGFAGHWALVSDPRGFLPIVVKAPLSAAASSWRVPQAYAEAAPPFWTAWVPAQDLGSLAAFAGEYTMSLPVIDHALDAKRAPPPHSKGSDATDLVIGVIDQGCAFLNRSFTKAGDPRSSRFISLWRQRPAALKAPWQVPADMGYGLELGGDQISQLLTELQTPADEAQKYEAMGYPVDTAGHFSPPLHGTSVLDIAAGLPLDLPPEVNAKPAAMDAAASAALVFVDLPAPLAEDATGASGDAYLLDAVHYILRRAGPTARVIINISIGSLAGPHDGSSLIEQALDALVEAEAGRLSICVAAGNAALERWHASGTLRRLPHGESASLTWRTVPGDLTDSFLELWCLGEPGTAMPPLQLEVTAPNGQRLYAGLPSEAGPQLLYSQGTLQASLDLRLRPQLENEPCAVALLSLAPTAGPRAGQAAGAWRVKLTRANSDTPLHVAAWLQRDTPGLSRSPVLQSEIESVSDNLDIDGSRATSALSGARSLITVGAFGDSDRRPSRYSPTRGIQAWAACDESPSALGKICTGALSGSTDRIAGTSAAAPMVARALAGGAGAVAGKASPAEPQGAAMAAQGPLGRAKSGARVVFTTEVDLG